MLDFQMYFTCPVVDVCVGCLYQKVLGELNWYTFLQFYEYMVGA